MKKLTVISHTHWDREWYRPYETFRLNLVRLIDNLLDIIKKDNSYIFHLDAQTVILEDYLELRPQNKSKLKKYVKSGNIVIGPWYLQNDFFLTDGESTVRNLLYGRKIAQQFGACSNIGYMPDQFGIISSMPKILNGFNIDSVVFGRGYMEYVEKEGRIERVQLPTEFIWKCEDGSECYAVFLRCWYNNAQRIPDDIDKAIELFKRNELAFDSNSVAPSILLMNGVDHLFPQKNVKELCYKLSNLVEINQCRIDEYFSDLKKFIFENKIYLSEFYGDLTKGNDYEILKGCWSSRIYLKQSNVEVQNTIINRLEPLYSYLEFSGLKEIYPYGELEYMWKSLMKLHPHDSICGCSCDDVHLRMKYSFSAIAEMSSVLERRGMNALVVHSSFHKKNNGMFTIALFNSTERTMEDVVCVELDFPKRDNIKSFDLQDEEGNHIFYEITKKIHTSTSVYSDNNLPITMDIDRLTVCFNSGKIKPYSSKYFSVITNKNINTSKVCGTCLCNKIENDNYIIGFDKTPYITCKSTNYTIYNPFFIEDSADCGDSYVYRKSNEPALIFEIYSFKIVKNTTLKKSCEFIFNIKCPLAYNFNKKCRSKKMCSTKLTLTITLNGDSDIIDIKYYFKNKFKDHRLRLGVNVNYEKIYSDSPYDFSQREDWEHCKFSDSNTHFNSSFISCVNNNDNCIDVYTVGQHEFEKDKSAVYLTLLRATGAISRNETTFEVNGGTSWVVPDNQVLGDVSGRLGVRLSKGFCPSTSYVKSKQYKNGLISAVVPVDPIAYHVGKTAVQSSNSAKYYLDDDYFAKVKIKNICFCDLLNNYAIVVAALKRAENSGGIIIRLINFSQEKQILHASDSYTIHQVSFDEKFISIVKDFIEFKPKEIKTLLIKKK